jgi:hypothetical protein
VGVANGCDRFARVLPLPQERHHSGTIRSEKADYDVAPRTVFERAFVLVEN